MSKKNKGSSGKTGKKSPVKKTTKNDKKPSAKSKPAKKPVTKKAIVKKAAKVPAKKAPSKPVSVKKPLAKKPLVKKAVKPIKSKVVPAAKTKKVVAKAVPAKKTSTVKAAVKPSKSAPVSSKANITAKKPEPKPVKAVSKPIPAPPVPKKESASALEKAKKSEELITKKQLAEKRSLEVLAITNTIPVKAKNEISQSKIASISHSITNPIKKTDSYAVKPEKEPNGKFELEFVVHSSAEMLYEFLSTPSGLSEWFCDDLNIRNGIYTFIWDDQLQQARLLKTVELHLVRFQWVDKTDGSYFEFRIQRDDLTNDISLIITDFAENVSDRESSKLLWHSQIEKLMHVIGSIF